MPDEYLVKYIRNELAMGRTEDVLRPLLLNGGWAEKDIDEVFAFVKGQTQSGVGEPQVPRESPNIAAENASPASPVPLRSPETPRRGILKKKKIALVSLCIFLALTVLGQILLGRLEQNPSAFKLFGLIYAIVLLWFIGYGFAYVFSSLAAKVYGAVFFTLLAFWIGALVFLVWVMYTRAIFPSSQIQTNNVAQSGVSAKTAEAIQGIHYLVQQFGGTLLDATPTTRTLHPVFTTASTTFSLQGITFRVPWTGVSKTGKGNPAVVVSKTFTNGRSFFFMPSVPMSAADLADFSFMSSTLSTPYAIENAELSATPDQVTSSTPGNQAVLTYVLLDLKALLLIRPPVYRFDTGFVRGFQGGDASPTRPVTIDVFDQKGTAYTLGITGTQGEIDYVLASIKPLDKVHQVHGI